LPEGEGRELEVPEPLASRGDRMKLLFLTKYYAHKNLESLIELFSEFRSELSDVLAVINLANRGDRRVRSLLHSIQRFGLEDSIVNVGFIPYEWLGSYFRSCDALFLPTLLECFSGTYVEAMRYQLPILTSDLDFAHAVCGDAAIYFDPWDIESMKDAILQLKSSRELALHKVSLGKERLRTVFRSWDDNAAELLTEVEALVDSDSARVSAGTATPRPRVETRSA
jgi:glycosyltransferase involved in cell wall biosynthesis